ncbi:MAG: GntR family transcriptional regulator [Eubacterium sp.]|jgi:GntR family transcriptional regulator|nr:GntR family transcriptional regulator [Eubacterium sp.]
MKKKPADNGIATMEINKSIPVPLYYQLIQVLLDSIKSGKLSPGDAIPTENELQEAYGVSRTTIRKAISELVHENVLETRRPKGVFVCKPRASEIANGVLTSFTEEFIRMGYKPGMKLLKIALVPANNLIADQLGVAEGDPLHYICRLRLLNDEPVCISHVYIPSVYLAHVFESDFSENGPMQSLYNVLEKRHGIRPSRAVESVSAILLCKEEAGLLNLQQRLPAILRARQVYDADNRLVLYDKAILRYTYKTTLVR